MESNNLRSMQYGPNRIIFLVNMPIAPARNPTHR